MLILEIKNLKKYFGEKLILDIENLRIDSSDKIGIVGVNGSGKSTLLNIIAKKETYDEGLINLCTNYSYIEQFSHGDSNEKTMDRRLAGKLGVHNLISENKSGGEITKEKIAEAFSNSCGLLIADEPTSNLDIGSIEILEKSLKNFPGAIVLVSHDRNILNNICTKIIEIEFTKIKVFNGNYNDYVSQKEAQFERSKFEYEEYIKEKKRLELAAIGSTEKSKTMRGTPKRMGNSEARLHKRGINGKKEKLEKKAKTIESRIEHLEKKEKPKESRAIKLSVVDSNKIYSKIAIEGKALTKSFGSRVLFKDSSFKIPTESKTAIIGNNGTGKTTLINMILTGHENIKASSSAKIAYFSQNLNILNEEKTILQNVMDSTSYDESFVRIVLSQLLFFRDDVFKKVAVLSGGEKVKVSLAKVLLTPSNILVLDEPTNYLDITSQKALEELLKGYDGTLLMVSHDKEFIRNIANRLIVIENEELITFNGTYDSYLAKSAHCQNNKDIEPIQNPINSKEKLMVLENELSLVISKLSITIKEEEKIKLDNRYFELLKDIKALKQI